MIDDKQFIYEIKKVQWLQRLLNYWTMTNSTLELDIKKWEIYEIDFGINVHAEISGRHYGIALHNSPANNPLISIIPIKSNRNKINPFSDIDLGKIDGIDTKNNSIAVINQINTIDKLRIFNCEAINKTNKQLKLNEKQIKLVINGLKSKILNFV